MDYLICEYTYTLFQSVHTVCSGQEVVSYCDEVASTKALAGSVADTKSLGDSTSLRVAGADNISIRSAHDSR